MKDFILAVFALVVFPIAWWMLLTWLSPSYGATVGKEALR